MGLIGRSDVQTDLAVTPDEKTKIDALRASLQPQGGFGGGGGAGGGQGNGGGGLGGGGTAPTPPTPAERAAREADMASKIDAILNSDQSRRLREIQIQLEGIQAISRKTVQDQLGLSTAQISQINELDKGYRDATVSVRAKMRSNEIDRPTGQADMVKNLQSLRDNLSKVLTADQTTKLANMGGKPFTADTPAGGAR